MKRETANALLLRLWSAQEAVQTLSAELDHIERMIADQCDDET